MGNMTNKKISSLLMVLIAAFSLGVAKNQGVKAADTDSSSSESSSSSDSSVNKLTSVPLSTKIIGTRRYSVYKSLKQSQTKVKKNVTTKKGKKKQTKVKYVKSYTWKFGKKICSSTDFKYAHVQSRSYKKIGNTRYYYIYVDGRGVGYLNEKAFALSKISLAKSVSLVNNSTDTKGFDTRDAINYVTDSHGSVVDNNDVNVSKDRIFETTPGSYKIVYSYGSNSDTCQITVRSDANEGVSNAGITPADENLPDLKTWFASEKTDSDYSAQDNGHTYYGTDKSDDEKAAELSTTFYEPNQLSLFDGSDETRVLTNVQGLDLYDNDVVTTNFSSNSSVDGAKGHIILYDLNHISKTALQYIPTKSLGFNTWLTYVKNIKISPYFKLGHGQSVGSTKDYVYEIANWNHGGNLSRSDELLQINKKTLKIEHIWTFKVWNTSSKYPRFFLNADMIDDNTIIALFHNASRKRYEYWKITRDGDNFTASEIAATGSNLVSNSSQVQGFTYNVAHNCYYIAFNDYIFKMDDTGKVVNYYKFDINREIEGLSSYKDTVYVGLNKRAEMLSAVNLK